MSIVVKKQHHFKKYNKYMNTTINANKKPTEESEKKKEAAKWTLEQEELLAEWAEKAACYRWLHNKSEKQYRCRNYAFTIPVIILSTTLTKNFLVKSKSTI